MEKNELISAVTRAQSGDSDAISELYEAFYNSVYYFAKKTVHDDDIALDITQETFMEVIRTIGSLKAPEAFSSWLRQITYHQCTRHFKKNKEVLFEEDEEGNSILDTIADESEDSIPSEVYEKAEFREIILNMIDTLSPEQRAVVILYYYDELPVKKIAEIQEVSEGTVKSRLNYARRALRDGVETYEKKTGTKLHGVPFLPLFKLFLDAPAEIGAAEAAAIGEAVSTVAVGGVISASAAAATVTATSAATAAATAATAAITIPLGAKICAAVVAVAVAIGAGTAIVKNVNTPSKTKSPEAQIVDTADDIDSPNAAESDTSELVTPPQDEQDTTESDNGYEVPETEYTETEFTETELTQTEAPETKERETDASESEAVDSEEFAETAAPESDPAETTAPETETETATEEETPDHIQYIPTCLRTHIKPTLSLDGDILTITNHTWEFEESNRVFDDLTIYIDGVETHINGYSELVNHNGPIVSFTRVADTVSFSLLPYTTVGTHTITVKTVCISADANNVCVHSREIGDVEATIEYTRAADEPGDGELAMGEACTSIHEPPTLDLDDNGLLITNHTWDLYESNIQPDSYYVFIDGNMVAGPIGVFNTTVSVAIPPLEPDVTHVVTVMSRCQYRYENGEMSNIQCDPYSSESWLEYCFIRADEESVAAEPVETVEAVPEDVPDEP